MTNRHKQFKGSMNRFPAMVAKLLGTGPFKVSDVEEALCLVDNITEGNKHADSLNLFIPLKSIRVALVQLAAMTLRGRKQDTEGVDFFQLSVSTGFLISRCLKGCATCRSGELPLDVLRLAVAHLRAHALQCCSQRIAEVTSTARGILAGRSAAVPAVEAVEDTVSRRLGDLVSLLRYSFPVI
jgi:hypothetical protein